MLRYPTPEVVRMEQAAVGPTEQRRQAVARWRWRQLRRQLCREGAQEAFLPQEGEEVAGFTLEARLGAGSYGTVFRARRGERLYALKLLYLPHTGAKAWREVEVLLRLHLARLVEVECHGHYREHPEAGPLFLYVVTGYVPGLPMDGYVERHNPGAAWAAKAVRALAWQLVVAHSVGVVHRDLKPDNVVVREDGHAVLVDYGVGTFPGALKVSGGKLPNIALLRAPEAWRFQRERQPHQSYEASARDDLWALGGLLYWLLTGTWPFEGDTEQEVEDAVVHGAPVPPHERNARVPQVLSEVCLRMLEKAPEARYPDARAVCGALEAALAGADAGWEVALCEPWAAHNATTRSQEELNLEQSLAHHRRLLAYEREHPRRGKPTPLQRQPRLSSPGGEEALEEVDTGTVAEPEGAPATGPATGEETRGVREMAARGEEVAREPAPAPGPVASGRGWSRALTLGMAALLASAHVHSASPLASPSMVAALPARSAMSASWVASGQEVARAWCPLKGGSGAAPAWAATPAPVALATLPEDSTRVKTSRKDASTQHKKQGPVRNAVAHTLCTAAMGALAAGCPGAQVRATPPPEACPPGSLETMQRLGIRTGGRGGTKFAGVREPGYITVREGPGARLELRTDMGQLEAGTVLTGRLLFGKERVYGRFTEAQRPTGETYRVCMEAWSAWQGVAIRGLVPQPNGGPDTAEVPNAPDVRAVERFE
ncbi:protein kinase [Archangium gephyra]|uniref:serine/threonine protein kinase n=1 Tax=Archangium gephyra TaxID=48 RepID=UPI0035D42C6F